MNPPKQGKHFRVGTRVHMQVVCKAARDEPFVLLDLPNADELGNSGGRFVGVHLTQHNSNLSAMQEGKKYLVDGVIVNKGQVSFSAFFVYVESFKEIE